MWYVRSGSKVTGPFAEDQLRALRKRGLFSPVHQISTDRMRWESSVSLVKLLDAQLDGSLPMGVSLPGSGGKSSPDDQLPDSEGRWYYLDDEQQKFGPLTLASMISLLESGTISARTLVCAKGDTDWTALSQHPVLSSAVPRGPWIWFIVVFVLVIVTIAVVGTVLIVREHQKAEVPTEEEPETDKTTTPKETSPGEKAKVKVKDKDDKSEPKDPLLITSLDDEDQVKQAIGLVILGTRIKGKETGKVIEQVDSKGSCFAISPKGYLLTNQHVVDGHSLPQDDVLKDSTGKAVKDTAGNIIPVTIEHPVVVFFNRIRYEAKVLHVDNTFDLAVLKIERQRPQPYFAISRKNEFRRAGKCFALGYPGVANRPRSEEELALAAAKSKNTRFETILLDQNFDYSYQPGEISRVSRDIKKQFRIEHNAKIFHGNSGGPLVDA
ncbi:MAG: serine endoprotease, partial [Planctomycetaceae bacterium]|nr:serine endoprotease [Planctomycetaceae bacterium]